MERAITGSEILKIKYDSIELSGVWKECVGTMIRHGVVFFWGNSGNGKSTAALSFCKDLTRFGKVLYVPLEEGYSLSLQNGIKRAGLAECGSRFQILRKTTLSELDERLSKPKSPEFVAIDSFQYLNISYREYMEFKKKHKNKMLIFISHADGKRASGRAARKVEYDADLKLWVEGHTAFSKGRFIGESGKAIVWTEGAEKYWGTNQKREE
jgi:hypothetical protein